MRCMKIAMIAVASLVIALLLGLSGCGDDHHDRYYGNRDRQDVRYDRHDNDRHEERREAEHHEDRGGQSGHDNDRRD